LALANQSEEKSPKVGPQMFLTASAPTNSPRSCYKMIFTRGLI
jgi:hypothetical protein